jgi:acetylornithine/succinyldiaminopimelate/putrescine aminotransferase
MQAWRRDPEVVHTSTFAGAPLVAATTIACLDWLRRHKLVERSSEVGQGFKARLAEVVTGVSSEYSVTGEGLMIGVHLGGRAGAAETLRRQLLAMGYLVSTGGGSREVLVLTPPLNISEALLDSFVGRLALALRKLSDSPSL